MKENTEDYYSISTVAQVLRTFFATYILKKWWLLLLVLVAGVISSLVYYHNQKPKYMAVCTFILEEKSASGGAMAGLASQFGFNLASLGSGGSIFAGDNILEILKSKKVVQKVLLSQIDSSAGSDKTLADLYLDFTNQKSRSSKNPKLARLHFNSNQNQLDPIQDSVLNSIHEKLITEYVSTERTSKQGTIIKVQVTAEDGSFARLMTERLVEEASKLYLDLRIGVGKENIKQLQRRADSLVALLNNKSYAAAVSQPLDINPGLRAPLVQVEIKNRDKAVLSTLYGEVTKNLEASKLLLSQQTPVIQLLDQPGYLLDDNKKTLSVLLLMGISLSIVVYLFLGLLHFLLFKRKTLG